MIHVGIMAGQAEGAVRREPRHRCSLVARDTIDVGLAGVRIPVRRGAVTGGAIAPGVVMLFVATLAAAAAGDGARVTGVVWQVTHVTPS